MKTQQDQRTFFFVDEAGDPVFYNKRGAYIVGREGCSPLLLVGFIRTQNPQLLRKTLVQLRKNISQDHYLTSIPSVKKSMIAFHAKDDCSEIREKVFKTIIELDFRYECIVARKIESIFIERHKKNENIFYDDLLAKLFENKLHTSTKNSIYYAIRGNRIRQTSIEHAIHTATLSFETKWRTKITSAIELQAQSMTGEPCLQITDYMNWAVQRAFIKKEVRYFEFVKKKISYIVDLYDFDRYPKNFYHAKNQLDINKISPL